MRTSAHGDNVGGASDQEGVNREREVATRVCAAGRTRRMANAGGLRACIDLVTLLVCCNLLARTSQPDVIVLTHTNAPSSAHTGAAGANGGGGDLPALTRLSTAVPTGVAMDREPLA